MRPLDSYGPIRIDPRADGGEEVRMLTAPAFPVFPTRELWNPRTVNLMSERMRQFLDSVYGSVIADVLADGMASKTGQPAMPEFGEILREKLARSFTGDPMTILATESFSQMMWAAALSAPDTLVQPHELIFDRGCIYFEQEQDFSDIVETYQPVRAMSWGVSINPDNPGRQMLEIFLWCEGRHRKDEWDQLGPNLGAPRKINHAMHVCGFSFLPLNLTNQSQPIKRNIERHRKMCGFIRAIGAIAASPATTHSTIDARTKSERKKRTRRGDLPTQSRELRVLSLRRPEHGRYELDAATGRRQRSHWVRGHWRNQWYASTEEHRIIWIDGFVKGDPELGGVSGPKIHVARGDHPITP